MTQFQEEKGRFYLLDEDGKLSAEVTYRGEDVYAIDHTFVRGDLRGQGVAQELIKAVVDKARADNKKIIPVCSYAVKQFETVPEYADVLAK